MHRSSLADLGARLEQALASLGRPFLDRQRAYVLARQTPEGGFAGRQGAPDLYYTGFGLRAMALAGVSERAPWTRAARFLTEAAGTARDAADCLALCEGRRLVLAAGAPADGLDRAAREHPGAQPSESVYQTFLTVSCLDSLGEPLPELDAWLDRLLVRQTPEGGFADGPDDLLAGANPTAAAVMLLARLRPESTEPTGRAARFLLDQQRSDGGFGAHGRAPAADLLSTFTALVALDAVGLIGRARLGGVGRFVRDVAEPDGGFRATPDDPAPDVEYTYYGLGVLGLLAAQVAASKTGS